MPSLSLVGAQFDRSSETSVALQIVDRRVGLATDNDNNIIVVVNSDCVVETQTTQSSQLEREANERHVINDYDDGGIGVVVKADQLNNDVDRC